MGLTYPPSSLCHPSAFLLQSISDGKLTGIPQSSQSNKLETETVNEQNLGCFHIGFFV